MPRLTTNTAIIIALTLISIAGLFVVAVVLVFGHGDNTALITLMVTTGATVIGGLVALVAKASNANGKGGPPPNGEAH